MQSSGIQFYFYKPKKTNKRYCSKVSQNSMLCNISFVNIGTLKTKLALKSIKIKLYLLLIAVLFLYIIIFGKFLIERLS